MTSADQIPQLAAKAIPSGDTAWLKGAKLVAYAGIANPERFFKLLETLGATVVARLPFNDHQSLSNSDAELILVYANEAGAHLVTTEKDHVRLSGLDQARIELRARSKTLPIVLQMPDSDPAILAARIASAIAIAFRT